MIAKMIEAITEADLKALIDNQVAEGRTLEYKRQLPGTNDDGKSEDEKKLEFLKDVSAFANTAGGDILYGLTAVQGIPTEIVGVQSGDLDGEMLRLEGMLDTGLEPRVRRRFRIIDCGENRKVILLRIERSWVGPHRICFKKRDQFWGRNDAGNHRLDMTDLRSAFDLSSSTVDRIRAFRADRLIAISNSETPVPLRDGPKIVLHCLPIESFGEKRQFDLLPFFRRPSLKAMGDVIMSPRLNLEGLLVTDHYEERACITYTQIYRSGLIEVAFVAKVLNNYNNQKCLSTLGYESILPGYLEYCIGLLREIGANIPFVVALSLVNVRGLRLYDSDSLVRIQFPIDRTSLVLPEEMIEEFSADVTKILLPMFDLVWNACGYEKSRFFDQAGRWIERR